MKAKKKAIKKKAVKKKAAKKQTRGVKRVARVQASNRGSKATPNPQYLNAIAYLVSSEEREINLIVASTMGLVED